MSGQHVAVTVFAGASAAISVLVLVRRSGLIRRLSSLSTRRAEALGRERTLRTVAAGLVAARDTDTIFQVACAAITALNLQAGESPTVWTMHGDSMVAVVNSHDPRRNGRLSGWKPGALPEPAQLLSGRLLEVLPADTAARGILGLRNRPGAFLVIPVMLSSTLEAAFVVGTGRQLAAETRESFLALRNQVALALVGLSGYGTEWRVALARTGH